MHKHDRYTYHYICQHCKKPFYAGRKNAKFCSKRCYGDAVRGEKHHFYKGGYINKGGYLMVMHDGKDVLFHRLVMEGYLGRPLKKEELVHHINGNRLDNRLENLQVVIGNTEHLKLHRSPHDDKGKVCTYCDTYKPFSLYHRNRSTHDGYQARCIECLKALRKR